MKKVIAYVGMISQAAFITFLYLCNPAIYKNLDQIGNILGLIGAIIYGLLVGFITARYYLLISEKKDKKQL